MTLTFQDMIRHRPLVIAWVWELVCIAGAVYAMVGMENEMLGIAAIFAGVTPFAVVMLLFIKARSTAAEAPDRSKDIVQ